MHGFGALHRKPSLNSLGVVGSIFLIAPSPALGCSLQGAESGQGVGTALPGAWYLPVSCPVAGIWAFFTPNGCLAWGLKLDLWAQTRLGFVACPPRSLGPASHIPSLIPRGPPLSQHPTFLEIREVLGGSSLNPAQVMIWGRSHSSGIWQPLRGEEERKRWEEGQGLV